MHPKMRQRSHQALRWLGGAGALSGLDRRQARGGAPARAGGGRAASGKAERPGLSRRHALDTWAVVEFLAEREPAVSRVRALVAVERPIMSWINSGEVAYVLEC